MNTTVKLFRNTLFLSVFAAVAAASVVSAPVAGADPILPVPGGGSASDAISQLQSAGYDVNVNYPEGRPNVPLSECRVTNISRFGEGTMTSTSVMMMLMEPAEFSTANLDVVCPNAK